MKYLLKMYVLALLLVTTVYASDKAHDFTLQNLDGERITLSKELEKGPVLLDFWATWCKPCLKELPHVNEIDKKYSEKGLKVLTITIDNAKGKSRVKPLVKGKKFDFEVLYDTDSEVMKLFGGKYPPLTVLIDQSGEIVYTKFGFSAGDEIKLEEAIIKLFPEKPPATEQSSEE